MNRTAAILALACLALPCAPSPAGPAASAAPWWDDFPTLVQTGDAARAAGMHATASLCGAADDCGWGVWGQRLRTVQSGTRVTGAMHAAGLKALTWVEGFGTPTCYVVQLKKNPDGTWVKAEGTDVTRVFCNHWGWKSFDGSGEVRWVGLHTYWDEADYALPYNHAHPRYGAPPMRYPGGRIAAGYDGPSTDPRNSRVFDAGCGKSVLGEMWGAARGKPLITDVLRGSGPPNPPGPGGAADGEPPRVRGGRGGEHDNTPTIVPDPGFTPAEWAERTRQMGALTHFGGDKDSACPHWIDYARAETRLALDTGIDGMWVDNFSPWDSFNAHPIHHAFGEWSVHTFRAHLLADFSRANLEEMGVTDIATFDVRTYLQARVKEWGGNPQDLKDPRWKDPRWQDDPIWRAYLIHKRDTGTHALSKLYRALKDEAAKAGKPDFLVMGNDIPAFSLGWVRGDLDMVSTELTWGWWLATGPRGLMPPPLGSYVPVYKLAREHARSRFVNAWAYAANEAKGKPRIADVVHYQGLATHALPMPQLSDKTMGTEASNGEFLRFVRRAAPTFGRRLPMEEAGLYYSSSSELIGILPAGYRDHANQEHSFSFYGWGTALTWLHVPWRAVPEWKLNAETLRGLRLLVVPSAEVFPSQDVRALAEWVRAGGRLIVAGKCGRREGEAGNFARAEAGTTLAPLFAAPGMPGKGQILVLGEDPGFAFYKADQQRPEVLAGFAAHLADVGAGQDAFSLSAPDVSWRVGLTPYRDGDRLFVDVNNTDVDLAADAVTPTGPLRFTLALPEGLRGKRLSARVLAPGAAPAVTLAPAGADRVAVTLGPVDVYACVVIE